MKEIKNILVIGSGLMGSGIAQAAVQAGYIVFINDISDEIVSRGIEGIIGRWSSKLSKNKITREQFEDYSSRLVKTVEIEKVSSQIDFVIEAASENLEIKKKIFRSIASICRDDVFVASNTSSLSITKLAAEYDKPENFIGMHFFSPVPVMKLLEVVPGLRTSEATIEVARSVGAALGKICIISKDSSGFIVNHLFDPMLNEAIRMVDDGIGSVEDIDNGMKYGCGHPLGPLELVDMVGADVLFAVMQVMHQQTGNKDHVPAQLLTKMVESGFLGRKTGKGFYLYDEKGDKIGLNPCFK